MLTDFRERGREEEREGEKHRWLASHMRPYWGPNPQRRYVLWLEIKPATFSLQDDAPTNWATLARAEAYCLNVQWNVAKFIYMHTYRVVCLFCIVISHLYFLLCGLLIFVPFSISLLRWCLLFLLVFSIY